MSNLTRPSEFFGPGLLNALAVLHREIVLLGSQPWLLVASSFAPIAFRHTPLRLGDKLDDRRLELRRLLVRLAGDDVAMVDVLPVAPIIEE